MLVTDHFFFYLIVALCLSKILLCFSTGELNSFHIENNIGHQSILSHSDAQNKNIQQLVNVWKVCVCVCVLQMHAIIHISV